VRDQYRLRFIGRFVFACEVKRGATKRVTALAMDMTYNPDLQCCRHDVLMAAPRSHTKYLGARLPDWTTYAMTEKPDVRAQVFVWNLAGHDVSPANTQGPPISLANWEYVPNVGVLGAPPTPRQPRAARSLPFDKRLLSAGPTRSVVTSRFSFSSGAFTASAFDAQKKVSFEPLGQGEPQKPPTVTVTDAVDVDVIADGPLYLTVEEREHGTRSSIVLTPPEAPRLAPVVAVFSNLCTRPGSNYDREFAAFYDVLMNPPRPRSRLIPYGHDGSVESADGDCSGNSTLTY
jgi:hypothetical protein